MAFLHITDARYVGGYRLWLRFNEGSEGVVDLAEWLEGPMFEPLRDINLFKQFRLDPEIETVVWPNGADLAPEFLYEHLSVTA